MNEKTHTTMDSPVGRLLLVGERTEAGGLALDTVMFCASAEGSTSARTFGDREGSEPEPFADIVRQLEGYFAGNIRRIDVPHTERGTAFQQRVWAAIEEIPYGTTITYGELAERVGAPRDRIRAVAAAVGANPLLVVRPCHRVIGANGAMTGYAGGVQRKQTLLVHEGALQPQLV